MLRGYIYLNSLVSLNHFYIDKILDFNKKLSELLSNNNENDWINSDYSNHFHYYDSNIYKRFYLLNHKLMYTELIFI